MKCPRCRGKGKLHHIKEGGTGFGAIYEWHTVKCSLCGATGHITYRQFRWCREAQRLWELRASLDYAMGEAARKYGTTVLLWNEAEHGRADPLPMIDFLIGEGATA